MAKPVSDHFGGRIAGLTNTARIYKIKCFVLNQTVRKTETPVKYNNSHTLSLSLFLGQFALFVNLYVEINRNESLQKHILATFEVGATLHQVAETTKCVFKCH